MSGASCCVGDVYCFFFKQKTAYELRISDWSSAVCSSDLIVPRAAGEAWGGARKQVIDGSPMARTALIGDHVPQGIRDDLGIQRPVGMQRQAIGQKMRLARAGLDGNGARCPVQVLDADARRSPVGHLTRRPGAGTQLGSLGR